MDLANIKPHKVSRDLTGYSILIYGDPKTGKTTIASQFPESLLLAFEKGYSALPGVKAQPLDTWVEMLKVLKELKKPEIRAMYKNIIIDTVDLAYDAVEEFICDLEGVNSISEIPYGKGYSQAGSNFDKMLRDISKMGYGVILLSHSNDKTIKDEKGNEFNRIQPTLGNTPRKVVLRFCDIVGYARIVDVPDIGEKTLLYLRAKPRFEAGSRFKYTPQFIEFTYDNLVDAIQDAIEKQEKEKAGSVVNERISLNEDKLDASPQTFEQILEEFNTLTQKLVASDPQNRKKIEYIIEHHIGKGKKVADLRPENKQVIALIIEELQALCVNEVAEDIQ